MLRGICHVRHLSTMKFPNFYFRYQFRQFLFDNFFILQPIVVILVSNETYSSKENSGTKNPGSGVRGVWYPGPRGQNREIACKNDIDGFTCPNSFLINAEK